MELKEVEKLIVNGNFEAAAEFFEKLSEQFLTRDEALSDQYACISMYLTTHCLKLKYLPMHIKAKEQSDRMLSLEVELKKQCIELNEGLAKLYSFVCWISEIADVFYHSLSIKKVDLITIWNDFKRNVHNENLDKLFETIWLLKANLAEHVTFQSEMDTHQDRYYPTYIIKKGKYLEYYRKVKEIDKIKVLISDVVIFKKEFDKLKVKLDTLKDNAGIREQVYFENLGIYMKIESYLASNFYISHHTLIRESFLLKEKVAKTAPTYSLVSSALVRGGVFN